MSGTNNVYTITIGNAGTYNNDGNVNMAAIINRDLSEAPAGAEIKLVFEPGNYALASTILLPSNTEVIGNGATLSVLAGANFNGSALMANADSYYVANSIYDKNTDGTTTYIPYNSASPVSMTTNASTAIIDSNIIVSGLVFNEAGNPLNTSTYADTNTDSNVFGTWFTNAEDVCVQNNVYIGGCDGNALVNVVNAVVAGNISVGQDAAYDNWNGPVNITIEDNDVWQYSINDYYIASAVQINSTPSGDPSNPGTASNDGIIDNLFSGTLSGLISATNIWPLPGFGSTLTPTYDVTQQGNVDSLLDTPGAQGYYMDYTQGSTEEDNILSQAVVTSNGGTTLLQDVNWGPTLTSKGDVIGNLLVSVFSSLTTDPLIVAQGPGSSVSDNAVLGESALNTNAFSGTSVGNNLSNSGTSLVGATTIEGFGVVSPQDIILGGTSSVSLVGTLASELIDTSGSARETVSLITQFGSLLFSQNSNSVTETTFGVETTYTVIGNINAVNEVLSDLIYLPNALGASDSIEIVANDSDGHTATRYIPILSEVGEAIGPEVITIGSGFLSAITQSSSFGSNLPVGATLTGEVLIAVGNDNILTMGSTASTAFLGGGSSTVQGGSNQEFIETGNGNAVLNLTGSGKITVAGGAGPILVNAATSFASAMDFIQTGSANATVMGGAGAISVIGGLGNLTYTGGSGSTYLATLPADGGTLQANLGSGNSTVFALSGNSDISSEAGTTNEIYLGIGATLIRSAGTDELMLGAGATTIDAAASGRDVVMSAPGIVTYYDDTVGGTAPTGILVAGGTLGTSISGAASAVAVLVTYGGDLIVVSQDASIRGGQFNDTVIGGAGLLSYVQNSLSSQACIIDSLGDANVTFRSGADTFMGGAGLATIAVENTDTAVVTFGLGGGILSVSNTADASIATAYGASTTISLGDSAIDQATITSYGHDQITAGDVATINSGVSSSDQMTITGAVTVNASVGSNDTIVSTGILVLNEGMNNNSYVHGAPALATADISVEAGLATISAFNFSSIDVTVENASLYFINTSILPQTVKGGVGGHVSVSGGSGGGIYVGGSGGDNYLIGGGGVVTLTGGGSGDYLQANSSLGINVLESGSGAETLNASTLTGSNDFIINPGAEDNVVGQGGGVQTFVLRATAGDTATLTGSAIAGALNVYNVETGSGYDGASYSISNFAATNGFINITNSFATGAPDCGVPTIEADPFVAGGTLIMLDNGTSILLQHCNPAQLSVVSNSSGMITIK